MIKCEFKEDYIIVQEGEKGESLFIIREGFVSCVKNQTEIRKLYEKDYFGESSILFETKRTLSIYSVSKTICFNITKNVLIETLGDNFKSLLLSAICKEAFLKSSVLQGLLLDDSFSRIYRNFSLKFYENNQVVINKTESKGKKIIVLVEGNLVNVREFNFRVIIMI
jgi:cGMP-dependent protein kinase